MEKDLLENSQIKDKGVGFQYYDRQGEFTKLDARIKKMEAELKAKIVIDEQGIPDTKEVLR